MLRKIVTLTLVLTFFCLFLTSVFLYLSPYARVAAWADWTIFGLNRDRLIDVHVTMGFFLLLLGALHLILDWRTILESLRGEGGEIEGLNRPLLAAFGLTLFVFAGTLLGLPPMAQLLGASVAIKDSLSETYGEPPYGHAELTPLDEFCRRFGIDLERAKAALAHKNIRLTATDQTLKDIARDNGLAPGGVYEALKHAWEASRTVTVPSTSAPAQIPPPRIQTSVVLPADPPPGLGKRRLSDICEEYGLDLARMTEKLKAGGIDAPPALTLKEIADKNGLLPIDIYDAMRSDTPIKRPPAQSAQPQAPAQSAQAQAQSAPAAPGQAPGQAPSQPATQPTAQTGAQTPAQAPGQLPAQVPGQTPAQALTPGLLPGQQVPGQTPGQLPIQAPGQYPAQATPQFPAQTGMLPQEPWQPGYERPASPAQSGLVVPPPDLDKTMLSTFCREFDLPLTLAVDRLAARGITAFGDMTFQELALENNVTPDEVMRIILTP
ncbi:hypothetical protein ASZ90_001889 [hydrocarbon metagenome]|uniref:Flavinylation-associated cytochrome domain-containing protein n=1 Tax=hydrocarbon metagenome TaxID=938273 RepID=A0A0W8G510_9ZZZZ